VASLGVEIIEEAVEPVTGYRVDILLCGGSGGETGRCAVEVRCFHGAVVVLSNGSRVGRR
jgi:hypothetical protein